MCHVRLLSLLISCLDDLSIGLSGVLKPRYCCVTVDLLFLWLLPCKLYIEVLLCWVLYIYSWYIFLFDRSLFHCVASFFVACLFIRFWHCCLHCSAGFSLICERGSCSLDAVQGLLIAAASVCVEHSLWGTQALTDVSHGLSGCLPGLQAD